VVFTGRRTCQSGGCNGDISCLHVCFIVAGLQGINVRNRARELLTLITDRDKLEEEREKVRKWVGRGGVVGNKASGGGQEEAHLVGGCGWKVGETYVWVGTTASEGVYMSGMVFISGFMKVIIVSWCPESLV
jgi:hypothetical protein